MNWVMLMWYVLIVVLCLNERLKNWCIDYYVVVNFAVIYLQLQGIKYWFSAP